MDEEQRIALGLRPRTLTGWWFWLRYWSPPALWWLKMRRREGKVMNREPSFDWAMIVILIVMALVVIGLLVVWRAL